MDDYEKLRAAFQKEADAFDAGLKNGWPRRLGVMSGKRP
jgi:hypothetical protein